MFALLVIGGVSGEWWYGKQLSETADSLQRIADGEVSAANQKASEADARAKSADASVKGYDKQIADDKARIAEAKAAAKQAVAKVASAESESEAASEKAEGFRLDIAKAKDSAAQAEARAAEANLELARLKIPRSLNKDQLDRVRSKMVAFAGTPFDLWVSVDSDSIALMYLIDEALRSAGWVFTKPDVSGFAMITFADKAGIVGASGIIIEMTEDHRAQFASVVSALTLALTAEGIAAVAHAVPKTRDKNSNVVHVVVGSKPLD